MTRRGDPARIYQAQRAGIFMRLVSYERLDHLVVLDIHVSARGLERNGQRLPFARLCVTQSITQLPRVD